MSEPDSMMTAGLFVAMASAPELLPPSVWPEDALASVEGAMARWNATLALLNTGELAAPEDPEERRRWAEGYCRGAEISERWQLYSNVDLVAQGMRVIENAGPEVAEAAKRIARFFDELRFVEDTLGDRPFEDADIQRLDALLEELDPRAEEEDRIAIDASFVHGILTFRESCEEAPPLSEALDVLYVGEGEEPLHCRAETVLEIARLSGRLAQTVSEALEDETYLPLLNTFDGEDGAKYISAVNWVDGYRSTAEIFRPAWDNGGRRGREVVRAIEGLSKVTDPPLLRASEQQMEEFAESIGDVALEVYDLLLDAPQEPVRVVQPPGRNEPCNCGSGKKYKKCCGAPA